jgi:hypothetical protein
MYVRAGKVIHTCRLCRQAQMRTAAATRARTMQSVEISRPVEAQAPAQAPAPPLPADPVLAAHPALDIPAGWGVNAVIDDERLVLRQSDTEGNIDEIALTRSEARTLFAHFGSWAA